VSRGAKILFGAALAGSLVLEYFRPKADEFIWDLPFFFTAMGLVGTLILTLLAKWVLSAIADRQEDYYEPYEITETEATGQGMKEEGYDW